MIDELLPIGSVVVTNDDKNMMILGYFPDKFGSALLHEYVCCDAKKGITKEREELKKDKDIFYIDYNRIKYVKFIGHQNSDYDRFIKFQKDYFESLDEIFESEDYGDGDLTRLIVEKIRLKNNKEE